MLSMDNNRPLVIDDKTDDIIVYSSDVEMIIQTTAESWNIGDIRKVSQRTWKALLQEVGYKIFKPINRSLHNANYGYETKDKYKYLNSDAYDYDKLLDLVEYYIYLSNIYNKMISIEGYCYMTGVDYSTIERWKSTEPGTKTFDIWQKLTSTRESALKDYALDTKQAVGILAVGNREYGWSLPGVTREVPHKQASSIEDIRKSIGLLPDEPKNT